MPIKQLLADLGVLPLRAIAFQIIFLLVAIALEAAVLRQRLRIGYKPSVQYAATLNLLATVVGWIVFLGIEPLLPVPIRRQIISYVLFNNFFNNPIYSSLNVFIVVLGLAAFFGTLWVKLLGLDILMRLLGKQPMVFTAPSAPLSRQERYAQARQGRRINLATSTYTLAVLQANALSFTALLLLLFLRQSIEYGP